MIEFNNRVDLQRLVIKILNRKKFDFELTGISKLAIDRWKIENDIHNEEIINILYDISSKLHFLANKSQEQITNEYKEISKHVKDRINILKIMLQNFS